MGKAKKIAGSRRSGSKPQSKSSGSASTPSTTTTATAQSTATPDALFSQAQSILADTQDPDHPLALLNQSLTQDPSHLPSLELAATLLLDQGQAQQAYDLLSRYHALDSSNPSVELYLGQLSGGHAAVASFRHAVTLLESQLATAATQEAADDMRAKAVDALCSIAEIYMTDLCFEPDAPDTCLSVLAQASAIAPANPTPYLVLASVHISRSAPHDAKAALVRGLDLWLPAFLHYLTLLGDPEREHELASAFPDGNPPAIPAFESRLTAVRVCLELGMWGKALDVLGVCVQEFDESVDVWYLFGWTYYLLGEHVQATTAAAPTVEVAGESMPVEMPDAEVMGAREGKKEWWTSAVECLLRAKALYESGETDEDEGVLAHVQELLDKMASEGVFGGEEDEGEAGEWEDDEEDGMKE
ncbi:hypothetical protein BCR44DRAFT_35705 [Catenaria anguillulae PL171]|uniref:TPR-like protein n=1 Tax=Catenaria anguillulae PL171 TaxID=765915 RepID=A0A1Y2HZR3_9FUNG|nr:hypothetical protein BCR44DRAFT_35705 [Catenaria anguillulae PL171]